MCICVHMSVDSWENISIALVVMETVEPCVYMCVCVSGDPPPNSDLFLSYFFQFLMFVVVQRAPLHCWTPPAVCGDTR